MFIQWLLREFHFSTTGRCTTVNARETAPASADRDMFVGNASDARIGTLHFAHTMTKRRAPTHLFCHIIALCQSKHRADDSGTNSNLVEQCNFRIPFDCNPPNCMDSGPFTRNSAAVKCLGLNCLSHLLPLPSTVSPFLRILQCG